MDWCYGATYGKAGESRGRDELAQSKQWVRGATEADLLDAYPRLTKADIHAAIGYAADTVAHEETVLVGASFRKRTKR